MTQQSLLKEKITENQVSRKDFFMIDLLTFCRCSEGYLEPSRTSTMKLFSQKSSIADVRLGSNSTYNVPLYLNAF